MSNKGTYRGLQSKFRGKDEVYFYDKMSPYNKRFDLLYIESDDLNPLLTGLYTYEGIGEFQSTGSIVDCSVPYAFYAKYTEYYPLYTYYICRNFILGQTRYSLFLADRAWDGQCPGDFLGVGFAYTYEFNTTNINGVYYPVEGEYTYAGNTYKLTYLTDF